MPATIFAVVEELQMGTRRLIENHRLARADNGGACGAWESAKG